MSTPRTAVRGPGAAHDERRQTILEAVFTIVDTEGTDHVTIRQVAAAAGVSVGRVQHYFPSKDDLLSEAFATINQRGTNRVHEKVPGHDAPPEKVLLAVLTEFIPLTDEDRRIVRVGQAFEAYALTRVHLREKVRKGYDELANLLALLLRTALDTETTSQDAAEQRMYLPHAYELLAFAIGLAGLVISDNLEAQQAQTMLSARLDTIFDTGFDTGLDVWRARAAR